MYDISFCGLLPPLTRLVVGDISVNSVRLGLRATSRCLFTSRTISWRAVLSPSFSALAALLHKLYLAAIISYIAGVLADAIFSDDFVLSQRGAVSCFSAVASTRRARKRRARAQRAYLLPQARAAHRLPHALPSDLSLPEHY